ncbi:hypothetical protein HUB98_08460 [Paenibacillus barcinonensis]|uniref:Uncharacterized protein n=1 Tax=Paenibacillus barcinonensis TaxID=198119 RepID=A0A2V4VRS3_PAEBA|nr:hypothetical protein [Paenibacillus barcinonensis]PYE47450.1 hypothetical protein DFQ00_11343 [Paenibacillus barcinonensis]QKS56366.1 hypothetical protein HUB98_08460 [Paenibacillus barcinonensis]
MSLFEWIFNNLYVVAVAAFVLFSFLGKLGKSANPNQKRPSNGMPTFGGGEDRNRPVHNAPPQQSSRSEDRRYEEQNDERYDDQRYDEQYDERYDQPYSEPAATSRQGDEFSREQSLDSMRSSVDEQMRKMEEQQRLIQDRLDRISLGSSPSMESSSLEDVDTADAGTSRLRPEDIRTGVLWAEVLGAPRAKQPFGTRGKL